MRTRERGGRLPSIVAIAVAIAAVSVLHYVAPVHAHHLHDIYRRLYYLPIIFAAFVGGLRGGLLAAAAVCIAYAPHAFGHISHDPATNTQKILEMALYFAVGLTTGSLVSRLQHTQGTLRASLEQLRNAEAELVQTARLAAVGRLSAGLAHEIRNPLASIRGSAELLADDFPPEHPKRRLLDVLVAESGRLNQVLSRFLSFARPRPMARDEIDLGREIDTVVGLLRSGQDAAGGACFTIDHDPGGSLALEGDLEQLRQVFLNLLLNASEAAGPNGEVHVRSTIEPGVCRVTIHDSGAGFSREAMDNAFTPFFTTKSQGTGLGLAISHKIIELHGGSIRVDNHPSGGGLVELVLATNRRPARSE